MTDKEFGKFINNVDDTFQLRLSNSQIQYWCKAFIKVDFRIAIKMVELFYNNSKKIRKPRPADLFEYKSWATKIVISELEEYHSDSLHNCRCCKNSGIIIVQKYVEGFNRFYDYGYRCFCNHGSKLGKDIPQLNKNVIREHYSIIAERPLKLRDKYIYDYDGNRLRVLPDDIKEDTWGPEPKDEREAG